MHKNFLTVVGITILFLGLTIQPSVATVQPEKIIVEPDVEGLVAQLRIVINEILQEYGYNSMVAYLCNYILGILDVFIFAIVCILIAIILIPVVALTILLYWIFGNLVGYLLTWVSILAGTWDRECGSFFNDLSIQPLRTISTLTDLDDCPCLQE